MARPMTAAEWRAAMTLWQVPVRYYPGWDDRGRPGDFDSMNGVMIHHTGSDAGQSDAYLKFLFVDGRSDLPAPLCHSAADMDGDLWMGATGRANHAGRGSSGILDAVVGEDYRGFSAELRPGVDNTDGNAHFYGCEVRYDGGQPMTPKQYATATRWAAAICHHYGWSALSVIGHREWTTRKPDPGNCPMYKFRADVAALLKAGPPIKPTPTPVPEDDMADRRNDIVGTNPDGSDMTQAELSARTNALYVWWLDNGKHGARLVRIDAELGEGGDTDRQLDRIEDDTDDGTVTPA
jgi:hypothetical protein